MEESPPKGGRKPDGQTGTLAATGKPRGGDGFLENLFTSFKTQTVTWCVGAVIALLGVFSTNITESIKFALNKADLRVSQYEDMAAQMSNYIFVSELSTEYIERGWTTREAMLDVINDYNAAIIIMRKNEFLYYSRLQRYWGGDAPSRFETFMATVLKFDAAVHSLNDQFEAVNVTKKQDKVDAKRAEEAVKMTKPILEDLRNQGRALLTSLS
jgi:hypothetical protein